MTKPGRSADAQAGRARGVYPALDGLRIVAVTAVIATHSAFWTGRYTQGAGRAVLAHLDIGVSIFFVISGFLISREWLAADRQTGGLPSARRYAWRRAARVLPMYWITVVIAFAAVPSNHGLGVAGFLRHFFLLQAYGDVHVAVGMTQTWSLCTEVVFYALVPGLAWVVVRVAGTRDRVPAVAAATAVLLALVSFGWIAWYRHDRAPWLISAGYWLPTTLCLFMVGTWLAAVRLGLDSGHARLRRNWLAIGRLGDSPGVCLLVALSAFGIAVTPLTGDIQDPFPTPAQAVAKAVLYVVAGGALVLPAVLGDGRAYDAVLGHPVLRYLGRISYSMFLLHLLVLVAARHVLDLRLFTGSFLQTFLLTWTITVAVSAVSYRWIEQPALRWRRRARAVDPTPSDRPLPGPRVSPLP